jgi:hypothetical protein
MHGFDQRVELVEEFSGSARAWLSGSPGTNVRTSTPFSS